MPRFPHPWSDSSVLRRWLPRLAAASTLLIGTTAISSCRISDAVSPARLPVEVTLDHGDCPEWPPLYWPGGWCTFEFDWLIQTIDGITGDAHCLQMRDVLWDLLMSGKIEKITDMPGDWVGSSSVEPTAPFGASRYNHI